MSSLAHRESERDPRETGLQAALRLDRDAREAAARMSDRERAMFDLISGYRAGRHFAEQIPEGRGRQLLRDNGAPEHAIFVTVRRDNGRWHVALQGIDGEPVAVEPGTRAEAELVLKAALGQLVDCSEFSAD